MFTCFIHSWYSLTDQCPQCSRTGGSFDSTELIINPTLEGVTAEDDLLSKELSMMSYWIDKIGGDNSATTRGAAKIKIGAGLKRMMDASKDEEIARLKEGLDAASEDEAIRFAEFISANGWQQYDGHDRWICPTENKIVLSTKQLYLKYKNKK